MSVTDYAYAEHLGLVGIFADREDVSDEEMEMAFLERSLLAYEEALGLVVCQECQHYVERTSCGLCSGCWQGQRTD